ncbi:MAG TPA: glycoside hydrolase family 2 protein [Pengzhenrongella sp.]
MTWQTLAEGWTLRHLGGPLPAGLAPVLGGARGIAATVPGCVHTDLLAAGLIPDPYLDDNEPVLGWIGRSAWEYATTFVVGPEEVEGRGRERVELVLAGVDTLAHVAVNGVGLAQTQNQFRTYRLDVSGALRPGDNELVVTFASALDHVERVAEREGELPHVNAHPFNELRKMACNFGWDWAPDLVTAGIGQPVLLDRWSGARIAAVRPLVGVEPTGTDAGARRTGTVSFHVDLEVAAGLGPVSIIASVAGRAVTVTALETAPVGRRTAVVDVVVPEVALWWPRGYGEHPLYDAEVVVAGPAGDVLDSWTGRLGFRTVALDTTPDAEGIGFRLLVNDALVLVRGANWVPDDAFAVRVDRTRCERRIDQAVAADVNLLRVWGGGVYESEDFYELADAKGLLVWQDFLFTCAAYRETEPLWSEVEAEAREAVARLSVHASLVLWCGGNEDIVAYAEWPGWRSRLAGRTWGAGYYCDLLPSVVTELDPTRPYIANSPYSFGPFANPNEPTLGDVHIWDVWNEKDYTAYRDWRPRFASEFGFEGPPAWSTLTRVVHDEPLRPDGRQMLLHQKAYDGNAKLARGLAPHLPVPSDVVDWHWATQLNQARAIQLGVEHFRSLAPLCTGTVLWQLNDCWPVVSWSVIDGDGVLKPSWYALRAAHADRLLTFRPDHPLAIAAVNDTGDPWRAVITVRRRTRAGELRGEQILTVDVPPRAAAAAAIPVELLAAQDPDDVLTAEAAGSARAWWYLREDVDGGLPAADLLVDVSSVEGGYRVRVRARSFTKDLAVLAERLDPAAVPDAMLVTLFPGEDTTILVATDGTLDPDALARYPVLRTANDLFHLSATAASGVER